jgi:putative oxidoreductase
MIQPVRNTVMLFQGFLLLLGRLMLSAIFFHGTVAVLILQLPGTVAKMGSKAIPFPYVTVILAIILVLLGSLSLAFGFKGRIGSVLLIVVTVAFACFFHPVWRSVDNAFAFEQCLAVVGGLLFVLVYGTGPLSIDRIHIARAKPIEPV